MASSAARRTTLLLLLLLLQPALPAAPASTSATSTDAHCAATADDESPPLIVEPYVAQRHPAALPMQPHAAAAVTGRRGVHPVAEARRALPAPHAGQLVLCRVGRRCGSSARGSGGVSGRRTTGRPGSLERAATPDSLAVGNWRGARSREGEAGTRRRKPVAGAFPLLIEQRRGTACPLGRSCDGASLRPL